MSESRGQTWKLGDTLQGRVIELLDKSEMVISINGSLWRVVNETPYVFQLNETVELIVKAIRPPKFQLAPSRHELRRKGQLNINI